MLVERLAAPAPPRLLRTRAAWALHAGTWFLAHALLLAALGRPWFSSAVVLAAFLTLVLVNNAKWRSLREPFVFQDWEYFTDAIRHPRLYLPFLGWGRFLAAALGFGAAAAIGWLGESPPGARFAWNGQLPGIALLAASGIGLLIAGNAAMGGHQDETRRGSRGGLGQDPARDLREEGLIATLWHYGRATRRPSLPPSPLAARLPPPRWPRDRLPHLIAVQSESFFDPRHDFPGIRPGVLAAWDRLRRESEHHGRLGVPSWGANTCRTEFAFLFGLSEAALGVHRFNPYHALRGRGPLQALPALLREQGFRTLAIHPYPGSFYRRDQLFPRFGFDDFLDISAFPGAPRFGPYIADAAVADKIAALIEASPDPLFIFAITMENHGPLHLEQVTEADRKALYTQLPPEGCDDLTAYLRHLRNADRMLSRLERLGRESVRPMSLCWYGDHVPILPGVYDRLGSPDGRVDYLCWTPGATPAPAQEDLVVHELPALWLDALAEPGRRLPADTHPAALA